MDVLYLQMQMYAHIVVLSCDFVNKLRKKQVQMLLVHTIIFSVGFIVIWTQFSAPPEEHEFLPEGWRFPDARVWGSLVLLMYYLFAVVGTFVLPKKKMKELQEKDKIEPLEPHQ